MKASDRALGLAMLSCHGGLGLTGWLRPSNPASVRGASIKAGKPDDRRLEDNGRIGARKG
jgi:hypothetical protein